MRIISGFLKGRNIKGYNIEGTRPTMDRIKESVFSIIQGKVKDSYVLDLFAGSGSYGLEAISNQASFVVFNDKNKECVKVIKENLENFNVLNKALVFNFDYKKCLEFLKNEKKQFDLIFLDPPYKLQILNDILNFIEKNDLLKKDGLVIVEFEHFEENNEYQKLKRIKEKKYGYKNIYIYAKKGIEDEDK